MIDETTIGKNRQRILRTLGALERPGMAKLLGLMQIDGFFDAPCSCSNHLACPGGLAQHSLNVLDAAFDMLPAFNTAGANITAEELTICALLHDLGKMGQYSKPNYIENILKSGKRSDAKPYETNRALDPIAHEVRSVAIASQYITLTEREQTAILWHNGLYSDFRYAIQGHESDLYLLIHTADMIASRLREREEVEA